MNRIIRCIKQAVSDLKRRVRILEEGGGNSLTASNISYDNSISELTAVNVQDAIDQAVALYNNLGWAIPHYATADLPPTPAEYEIAWDDDEDVIKIFLGGSWVSTGLTYPQITTSVPGYDNTKQQFLSQDSGTLKYEDRTKGDLYIGICETAYGGNPKIVTIGDGTYQPKEGNLIAVKYTNGSGNNGVILNINGSGNKNVYLAGSNVTNSVHSISANGTIIYYYDGSNYILTGSQSNTIYGEISEVNLTTAGSLTVGLITGRRLDYWKNNTGLDLTLATGYNNTKTQRLIHNQGVFEWEDV